MQSGGDLSQKQREQSVELIKFEHLVDHDAYPIERKAQMYTCLAHDWYQLDMEEEGNRLVLKAERVCPGYFRGPVIQHQLESQDFDTVIKNLTLELLRLLTDTLRNDG
jgi:hypothetical protein